MKVIVFIAFLIGSIYLQPASAQCATGVNTGGQCIPPEVLAPADNYGQQAQPRRSSVTWSETWGAIAEDVKAQAVGTAIELLSKSKAEDAATSACINNGGKKCEITWTFHNQCAAVALDENNRASYTGAPTKEKAEANALARLGLNTKPRIVYSACTDPVRSR